MPAGCRVLSLELARSAGATFAFLDAVGGPAFPEFFDFAAAFRWDAAATALADPAAVTRRFEFARPRVTCLPAASCRSRVARSAAACCSAASRTQTAAVSAAFAGGGALVGAGAGAWARAPSAIISASTTIKNAEPFTVPPVPAESA